MDICDICGDLKSTGFIQKLDCGHEFHYECILKSFKSSKDYLNSCPICRQHQNRLPIINGLKKLEFGIHFGIHEDAVIKNEPCMHILKTGKNKGTICNNNCKLGYNVCGRHLKFVSTGAD